MIKAFCQGRNSQNASCSKLYCRIPFLFASFAPSNELLGEICCEPNFLQLPFDFSAEAKPARRAVPGTVHDGPHTCRQTRNSLSHLWECARYYYLTDFHAVNRCTPFSDLLKQYIAWPQASIFGSIHILRVRDYRACKR